MIINKVIKIDETTNDKDKLLDMKLIIDAINTTKLSTSTIQQNEPPINMYL